MQAQENWVDSTTNVATVSWTLVMEKNNKEIWRKTNIFLGSYIFWGIFLMF